MGLFRRNSGKEGTAAVRPVEAERPNMSAEELERMVYATYQEKLELQKQLYSAKARIESLEESLHEKTTKLRVAEEYARQSERERKETEEKIEPLEQDKKQLKTDLNQAKARIAVLEQKVEELTAANKGRMDAYRLTLVDQIKQAVSEEAGCWSKARVLAFLDGCYFEDEA